MLLIRSLCRVGAILRPARACRSATSDILGHCIYGRIIALYATGDAPELAKARPSLILKMERLELSVPLNPDDLHHIAILLDVDGTLLDIAATPQEVEVPKDLPPALGRVSQRLDGAVALVSGRTIAELDDFFAPLRLPAIGGHGAELRPTRGGAVLANRAVPLDPVFKQQLKDIAERHPGVLIEDKGYSIALHYRKAPKQGVGLIHDVKRAYAAWADKSFELLTGKAVLEIKFSNFNKGTAVRELMSYAPFVGRAPIFVGDDRTDEDAFAVVPEFNGHAMSVGRRIPGVDDHFNSPADVRRWLERLADGVVLAT
jgi:trehalose 6-phosphate phosphatase